MNPALLPRVSVRSLDLDGRRLFVRADFNVPLDAERRITDDTRIQGTLPTLELALAGGASLVLASHLGRPKAGPDPRLSLAPVAARLAEALRRPVRLLENLDAAAEACRRLPRGDVVLLENLRFDSGERKGDAAFARRLAALADEYANDAFGASHRADASVAMLPGCFARPAAGLLLEREIEALRRLLLSPEMPFVAVLGGAKVGDKLPVLKSLLGSVDALLVGGAMACTFLAARGEDLGASLVEPALFDEVRAIEEEARRRDVAILLPTDHVVARATLSGAEWRACRSGEIAPDEKCLDVGPETREAWRRSLSGARTVLWNGPLGVFETPPFDAGTRALAEAVAACGAYSVVGGGDSVAALAATGLARRVSHVSTGGGALLEALAGLPMPGIASLAAAAERAGA